MTHVCMTDICPHAPDHNSQLHTCKVLTTGVDFSSRRSSIMMSMTKYSISQLVFDPRLGTGLISECLVWTECFIHIAFSESN